MKLLSRRPAKAEGAHVAAAKDKAAAGDEDSATVEWTGPAAWVTRGISLGLIGCLIAGPCAMVLAGWLMLSVSSAPAPASAVASDASIDERAAVEAFASDFVVTWLTTTADEDERLASFLDSPSGATFPDQPWHVEDAAPAGIVETDGGVWSVTVAATVADSDNSPAVRRYFRVPIVYTDGAMVAQMLPAPVAEPQQAPAPELAYRFPVSPDDPIAAAAGEFLAALLVGGDVTRVISPEAQIRPLSPPPYTSVEVDDVRAAEDLADRSGTTPADGEQLHVFVTAAATPAVETSTLTVQYALTLTARAGRWEVTAIDTAPALAPTEDSSVPAGDLTGPPTGSPAGAPASQVDRGSSTSTPPPPPTTSRSTEAASSGSGGSN